ncbi:hypothetical protein INR49_006898 [Caranx melampygus]|nr:hypothetical protein INR49_006898 [Caranx melampygus]
MSRQLVMMTMMCLGLALLWCSRGAEARIRLNSIRTVILREGHALPVNRSTWEPSLDLTTCRKRKRRCHRHGMCCPGNRCSNSICVPDVESFVSQRIPASDGEMSPLSKRRDGGSEREWTPKERLVKVRSEILACARRTVRTVCAAPVTSGLASASPCCRRDRFARDTAGRGTTVWSCSSAAHVGTD